MFKSHPVFDEAAQKLVASAIADAERQTSGEIKVHVEPYCKTNPMQRAGQVFNLLELYRTKDRNGVLIYLAYEDRKFAVLGDEGIHKKAGNDFWQSTRDLMTGYFKNGQFTEGLCAGIKEAGEQLKIHFPYLADDKDELSNDISFGGDHA